jgi:hypothetical protein
VLSSSSLNPMCLLVLAWTLPLPFLTFPESGKHLIIILSPDLDVAPFLCVSLRILVCCLIPQPYV